MVHLLRVQCFYPRIENSGLCWALATLQAANLGSLRSVKPRPLFSDTIVHLDEEKPTLPPPSLSEKCTTKNGTEIINEWGTVGESFTPEKVRLNFGNLIPLTL